MLYSRGLGLINHSIHGQGPAASMNQSAEKSLSNADLLVAHGTPSAQWTSQTENHISGSATVCHGGCCGTQKTRGSE